MTQHDLAAGQVLCGGLFSTMPRLRKQRRSCRKVCSLCHSHDVQHMNLMTHASAKDLHMQHTGIIGQAGLLHIHLSLCHGNLMRDRR